METRIVTDEKTGNKELKIDKRTLPKTDKPPHVKTLRYARNLPPECNMCPYRSMEAGGNGICNKYEEGAVCVIRKDFSKLVDKFDGERNSDRILSFLQAEFENNFERLAFFEQMEDMSGEINPEVTKRINAMNNMAKTLAEMRTKRESIEVTKTETLSPELKQNIADTVSKTLKITKSEIVDES